MNKIYTISDMGTLVGLWDDSMTDFGEPQIKRASNVEFCEEEGGWRTQILVGVKAGEYLPGVYKKRKEALEAEVEFLNGEIVAGRLDFDSAYPEKPDCPKSCPKS